MWHKRWREQTWAALDRPFDLIVIGGGITGAGVFNMASRRGLRVLLLEAGDFAFGTSSRSSKLVHGGFRYLRNRQFSVTHESVLERERLLCRAPHLVTPLPFLLPAYAGGGAAGWQFRCGVVIYDLMAPKWKHRHLKPGQMLAECPPLNPAGLLGGCLYEDAAVDDARMVIRIIREGTQRGGLALSYAPVSELLRDHAGQVRGVVVEDRESGRTAEVQAAVVINATGPWSDELRARIGAAGHIRKLRGSHIIFDQARLPLAQAVTLLHPRDGRALFAIPWDGVTLIGTTDHDHRPNDPAESEPAITSAEVEYLLEAGRFAFPGLELSEDDIIATFAGLRPTIDSGAGESPSQVSRSPALWDENGLITITGGKLTIYRRMALQALRAAAPRLPGRPAFPANLPTFDPLPAMPADAPIPPADWLRLAGRFGAEVNARLLDAPPDELAHIEALPALWAELRWAAAGEGVVHLDDLLLRRARLGLTLREGGVPQVTANRAALQPLLGWDDSRWESELTRYRSILARYYPAAGRLPPSSDPVSWYNSTRLLTPQKT